jgi:hypothetical protein
VKILLAIRYIIRYIPNQQLDHFYVKRNTISKLQSLFSRYTDSRSVHLPIGGVADTRDYHRRDRGPYMRRQVVTDMRVPNSVWKKRVSDTLYELNIIQENFSGKVVISFKDGGISYIEKTETFK